MMNTANNIGHDEVLARIAKMRFSKSKYEVTTNPSYQKNGMVFFMRGKVKSRVYPDILVVDRSSKKLVALGEVETAASVDAEEAQQWKLYGMLHENFYLYVPAGFVDKARVLIRRYAVRAHLRRFSIVDDDFFVEEIS